MSLPTEDSIRILVLHSGTPGSFISCSLQESRLGDAKSPYEALSYVWKPREGNEYKSIRLNGHTKTDVGVNLYNALQRLRHTDKDRLLWVDALCINQEHLEEKGKQVKMMKSIYAGADRVIVWLGDDEQGYAREAFATLCAVVNHRNSLSDSGIFQKAEYEASDDRGILTKEAEPRAYDEEWVHVNMLFANKWFLRLWVLQEIVLARKATFVWGTCSLPWSVMADAVCKIREDQKLRSVVPTRNFTNAFLMSGLWDQQNEKRDKHMFLYLLDIARSLEVTNQRDKVFSLLGLPADEADPETGLVIKPHYEKPTSQVYMEVARTIMEKNKNLNVLSYVLHGETNLGQTLKNMLWRDKIPSWVPDWSIDKIILPFTGYIESNCHKAGLSRPMELLTSVSPHVLRLKGVEVDVVKSVGPSVTEYDYIHESKGKMVKMLNWCMGLDVSLVVLCNTLCGHRDKGQTLVEDDEQYLSDFIALLRELEIDFREKWSEETAQLNALATDKGDAECYKGTLHSYMTYRRPFITEKGVLGHGSMGTEAGDSVVVLWGGQLPFVVRGPQGKKRRLIGEAYMHNLVHGEVEKLLKDKTVEEQIFEFA